MENGRGRIRNYVTIADESVFESDALQVSPTLNNQLYSKIRGEELSLNTAQQCAKLPVSVPNLCIK